MPRGRAKAKAKSKAKPKAKAGSKTKRAVKAKATAEPKQTPKAKAKRTPKSSKPAAKPKRTPKPKAPKLPRLAMLDELGAAARPVIAARGEPLVSCKGDALRFYALDTPVASVRVDAPIVAVARSLSRSAAIDGRGVLHVFTESGSAVASIPVGEAPRSLIATEAGRWVALVGTGLVVCDLGGAVLHRAEFSRPLAAAADPGGAIVVVGEDKRIAEWTGTELVDIPPSAEQIVAIASLGGGRFACVGQQHWFLLDLAQREMESAAQQSESPYIATSPDRRRIAWCTRDRSVVVGTFENGAFVERQRVTYPATYGRLRDVLGLFTTIEPIDTPLAVTGLAFLDDDRLAIALDCGLGNLIDLSISLTGIEDRDTLVRRAGEATRKLDEHPGDPHASWDFVYQGQKLMAR